MEDFLTTVATSDFTSKAGNSGTRVDITIEGDILTTPSENEPIPEETTTGTEQNPSENTTTTDKVPEETTTTITVVDDPSNLPDTGDGIYTGIALSLIPICIVGIILIATYMKKKLQEKR